MKLNKRIALIGVSGAGKDYCVKKIIDYLDSKQLENYTRVSFSDQLKKCGTKVFSWLKADYPPEVKEKPLNIITDLGEEITKSPREIWLLLNSLRQIENTLFVRLLNEEIETHLALGKDMFIISDIRTLPELEYCVKQGFKIIRIKSNNPYHKSNDFDKQQELFNDYIDSEFINKKDNFDLDGLLNLIKAEN